MPGTNGHVNPFYLEIEEDDELSEDEEFEQAGLLRQTNATATTATNNHHHHHHHPSSRTRPRKVYRRICLLFLVLLVIFAMKWDRKVVPGGSKGEKVPNDDEDDTIDNNDDDNDDDDTPNQPNDDTKSDSGNNNNNNIVPDTPSCNENTQNPILINNDDDILRYVCPCAVDDTTPVTHSMFPDYSTQILSNMTQFMKTFRHIEVDDWGHSYTEVKRGMQEWFVSTFAEYLTDNSRIYQSAIGDGLHLQMILSVLLEAKGIRNITVYGNDLSSTSVQAITSLTEQGYLPAGGKLGTVCQGDSTQLSFVPSESFDLVFTAYIPPLSDPLNRTDSTNNDPLNSYMTICKKAEDNDEDAMQQKREAQHRQDRWFAKWLGEMARIAKKGAPIVIHHIAKPFCEATFDWGGVSQDFWTQAAQNRGLDLDLSSLTFEEDKLFRNRYHMFIRKNQ